MAPGPTRTAEHAAQEHKERAIREDFRPLVRGSFWSWGGGMDVILSRVGPSSLTGLRLTGLTRPHATCNGVLLGPFSAPFAGALPPSFVPKWSVFANCVSSWDLRHFSAALSSGTVMLDD